MAGDVDHHRRLQGRPVVVPVRPAAQAAYHVPLAEVLDDCWNPTVNDLQTVFVAGEGSGVYQRLAEGGREVTRREEGVGVGGDQM